LAETYWICDEDFWISLTKWFTMPKAFTKAIMYVNIRDTVWANSIIIRLNDQVCYENPLVSGQFGWNGDVTTKLKQPASSNKFELMTTIPFNHVLAYIVFEAAGGVFTHYISVQITNRRTGKKVYQWLPGGPGYECTGYPRCTTDILELQPADPLEILLWLMKDGCAGMAAKPDNGKSCTIYVGQCGAGADYWFTAQPTYDSGTSYNYPNLDSRAVDFIKKYTDPVMFAHYKSGAEEGYSASIRVKLTAEPLIPTALTIVASPTPVQVGQQCTISGKLTRTDTGAGLAGKQCEVRVTGPENFTIPVVTDANGNYKTIVVFGIAGTYKIKPYYAGGT